MPTHKSGQAFTELVFISSDNQYTAFFFFYFLFIGSIFKQQNTRGLWAVSTRVFHSTHLWCLTVTSPHLWRGDLFGLGLFPSFYMKWNSMVFILLIIKTLCRNFAGCTGWDAPCSPSKGNPPHPPVPWFSNSEPTYCWPPSRKTTEV